MASALPRRPSAAREHSLSSPTIHNIVVAGRRTSVRLEPVMWQALREIAHAEGIGLNDLVTAIDRRREGLNLTAAIRVCIVDFYRSGWGARPTKDGIEGTSQMAAGGAPVQLLNARRNSRASEKPTSPPISATTANPTLPSPTDRAI